MLKAIDRDQSDHIPCSFMMFNGLKSHSQDYLDFLHKQLELGLDTFVELPPRPPVVVNDYYNLHGLPVSYDPAVKTKEWFEHPQDEEHPLMIKEYTTPAGVLRTEVWQTEDWRWGDHVPFLDDYLVPRSRNFLIENENDLDALQYLLVSPTKAEIQALRGQSQPFLDFAQKHDLLIAGGWGVGADLIGWVYGLQNMLFAVYDKPEFIKRLLEMIAVWNRSRMQVMLDAGIDLYIKRAWYENCDFWTPKTYREFIFPILKADVELAHASGVRFGYIISSNCMPLLDELAETGIDVVIGVDPAQWDLEVTRRKLGGKVCLWGGINGHLTVEQGSADMVKAELDQAMQVLGDGDGFILSPVDNVREYTPQAQENVKTLISEWQKITGQLN
jgi:hypothetical protein